jgi:hypothetical protein
MKKTILAAAVFLLITCFAALAHADLAGFLNALNAEAKADPDSYSQKLGSQFGVAAEKVHDIINVVENPADAFMVLQVGQMTQKEPEQVLEQYERNKGKGWGVIAQELGIKPGSDEFHALKDGDLSFTGRPDKDADVGPGKAKGKNKDKGKGRNK